MSYSLSPFLIFACLRTSRTAFFGVGTKGPPPKKATTKEVVRATHKARIIKRLTIVIISMRIIGVDYVEEKFYAALSILSSSFFRNLSSAATLAAAYVSAEASWPGCVIASIFLAIWSTRAFSSFA